MDLWAFKKLSEIQNFGKSQSFHKFGSVNICREARAAGSAGVHKYAVNLGLSAFKSVPEIWVWWHSQCLLNLSLQAVTELLVNLFCVLSQISSTFESMRIHKISDQVGSVCVQKCTVNLSAGFDKVFLRLYAWPFTKPFVQDRWAFKKCPVNLDLQAFPNIP